MKIFRMIIGVIIAIIGFYILSQAAFDIGYNLG